MIDRYMEHYYLSDENDNEVYKYSKLKSVSGKTKRVLSITKFSIGKMY